MYIDVAKEFGDVPLVVANDGDVTSCGAMELNDNQVLELLRHERSRNVDEVDN